MRTVDEIVSEVLAQHPREDATITTESIGVFIDAVRKYSESIPAYSRRRHDPVEIGINELLILVDAFDELRQRDEQYRLSLPLCSRCLQPSDDDEMELSGMCAACDDRRVNG